MNKNDQNPLSNKKTQKEITDTSAGFVRFLPRSKSKTEVPRRTRSVPTSPSAWALSPGRSFPLPVPKAPSSETLKRDLKKGGGGGVGGGGVSAVLKFFGQKKVSPVLEEDYHRFRVMHNRLLQWRFANARAEASMAAVKRVAEKKLFNIWVKISLRRNFMIEKRNEVVKLKQQIKLYEMMKSQMKYMTEWSRIEAKNCEAVGRVARKLSAISVCLPLADGAEVQVMSFHDAISMAMGVMDSIEAMIVDIHRQIETSNYVLMELLIVLRQYKEYLEELEKRIAIVTSLEVQENSLRVGFIQLGKEMKEPQFVHS
ncbi:QWRF motif-containing protein 7 [Abeliophyllum distichum]|uniref:QWRF motif-containing protein 7 n=1 Tax=Abeliophyllum distichum TaxID=126358 RepID=A0ABD1VZG8_9LAMI